MKVTIVFVMLVGAMGIPAFTQNFDADSVYYSPLPRVASKKSQRLQGNKNDTLASKRISYFFNLQSGSLIGCKGCSFKREVSFSAATVHGVTIGKKLRIGAGLGFDTYQNWHAIPVFGSISWDLIGDKNENALFLQFNYGWSKVMPNLSTLSYYQHVEGGRMVSTQVGYRIRYHDVTITLGIGSKYQRAIASYAYPNYYYDFVGTRVSGGSNTMTLRESMNRLSVMMSLGWK